MVAAPPAAYKGPVWRKTILCVGLVALLLAAASRTAWAQRSDAVCVDAAGATRALTGAGSDTRDNHDPEPELCDQRHWQTVMIFTGFVTAGFAVSATQNLLEGKRIGARSAWAMFATALPQAAFGIRYLATDLTDGDIDTRDVLLLGATVISTYVAAYSGWSLLRGSRERAQPAPTGIRVGAAPVRGGVMLGASSLF